MKIRNSVITWFGGLCLLGLLWVVGLIWHESPGLVDWKPLRAVAFESDDWGLAGFVPEGTVWDGVQKDDLTPGKFPAVYWKSTLEDSLMVADLCGIMGKTQGADGLPAVFQPNYVMSSLSYEKGDEGYFWRRYDLPDFPLVYSRPEMWSAVEDGIEAGLWYPEFHATWHYDPAMRLATALSSDLARKMTMAGVMLFPDSEKARELGPWRSVENLQNELARSSEIFQDNFHRPIGSIIAPDYTWSGSTERMWLSQGIRVIQAKREQRDPTLVAGKIGRVQKFLFRKLAILFHRDRIYLQRNCRLEPAQATDVAQVVATCLADTRNAWASGHPAIVETHRVNFAHGDPSVVRQGQMALEDYLKDLGGDPSNLPIFLVDSEIAQLQVQGVSWVIRGDNLILRNGTHSRRIVTVYPECVKNGHKIRQFLLNAGSFVVIKR